MSRSRFYCPVCNLHFRQHNDDACDMRPHITYNIGDDTDVEWYDFRQQDPPRSKDIEYTNTDREFRGGQGSI